MFKKEITPKVNMIRMAHLDGNHAGSTAVGGVVIPSTCGLVTVRLDEGFARRFSDNLHILEVGGSLGADVVAKIEGVGAALLN